MTISIENDLIRQRYNQFADVYDNYLSERVVEWIFIDNLRRKLLSQARGNVLEIGIGSGKNLVHYSSECQVTGIDISERQIYLCQKSKNYNLVKPKVLLANAEDIPFENRSFDFVVDCFGLCTYPKPKIILDEIARVCKDNGLILFLEHGISNNHFLARLQRWREKTHFKKLCCNQTKDIGELIRDSQLEIVNETRYLFRMIYEYVLTPKK